MSWVAIDFETANETRASACALGVAIVEAGEVIDRASWLIRPPTLDSTRTTS
jgi:DNA polymerase III subunit epsilon